ncbi:MAG: sugar ABC transporter permease [Anaerolineae bacterium]|nr:sugar ABC transporter permease [Anaerolineae bacterium]
MSSYLNIFDFSILRFILYIVLWAIIGGLPGFYMFFSRNHNPRTGARLGMITGVGLGVMFAGMDSLDAREIFNNTLFLWLWAVVMSFFIPRGNHAQDVSVRQSIADLAYGLLLPTFLIVMAIVIVPMIWNVLFAFRPIKMHNLQQTDIFGLDDLSLDNFDRVINARRGRFWSLLRISLFYTFNGSLLAIGMGLITALIVKDKFPGRGIYRGILLFPYIAPIVAVTIIWQQMLNARLGIVNEIISEAGQSRIDFLTTQGWALATVILFQGWRYFPFAFLFILARIQAIPNELYEAAKVDGAVPSQRLMYITLPQLRPVFGTLFLLRFIWTFNKFEDIFLLNGGAANTEVLPVQIYNWLFARKNIGASSAVALIMAAVLFLLVGIYFKWFLVEEE